FSRDIEPLVRLIEDTDRGKLLDEVARRIRAGTSYQELLSALFLAGGRGIQPRPVGFQFHAVLVINSAPPPPQTPDEPHARPPQSTTAGWRCSGLWTTSSRARPPTSSRATGTWPRSTSRRCRRPTSPGSASPRRWTTGTRRRRTWPSPGWCGRPGRGR